MLPLVAGRTRWAVEGASTPVSSRAVPLALVKVFSELWSVGAGAANSTCAYFAPGTSRTSYRTAKPALARVTWVLCAGVPSCPVTSGACGRCSAVPPLTRTGANSP